jgi:hypothetical protein
MKRLKKKFLRTPKQIPNTLRATWGRVSDDPTPDVVYSWGKGCSSGDSHLIHSMLNGMEHRKYGKFPADHDGYLKELEARGYDLTTLKFSIQKKVVPNEGST